MFQTKVLRKINTHILCTVTYIRKSCRLWDNVKKYCTARQATNDNIIQRMSIACWIPKATNTHSQHVILIVLPLQQWLHERISVLRYTYIVCHVFELCEITPFPLVHNAIILSLTRNSKHNVQSLLSYWIDFQANRPLPSITLNDHIQVSPLTCPQALKYYRTESLHPQVQPVTLRRSGRFCAYKFNVSDVSSRFLISGFRRVLYVVCFLLGNIPASEVYMPTFRNTLCSIFIGR